MDIFKEFEKLSTKYIDISDKKERLKLEEQCKSVFCQLETIKIAHRNEIDILSRNKKEKEKEVAKLEEDKQKLEIKIKEQKLSIASGLDMLIRKEAEFAKKVVEFEKQNAEFIIAQNETKKLYAQAVSLKNDVGIKLVEIDKKLAIDNLLLEQIKGREASVQMSIEKMETLITDNKCLESATLDEKSKVLDAQKKLAEDYSIVLKNKEDLEETKRLIGIEKQNLEKTRSDFQKEQNIIQTMKDELQEVIDKNNEKTKELAKRETDVKVASKNISDMENAQKAKELDIRMERVKLSEDKNKFNLLLKEKGLKHENLDI